VERRIPDRLHEATCFTPAFALCLRAFSCETAGRREHRAPRSARTRECVTREDRPTRAKVRVPFDDANPLLEPAAHPVSCLHAREEDG
jgi:hypothetical protein